MQHSAWDSLKTQLVLSVVILLWKERSETQENTALMLPKDILRKGYRKKLFSWSKKKKQTNVYGFLCGSGFFKRLRNGEVFLSLPDRRYRDGALQSKTDLFCPLVQK